MYLNYYDVSMFADPRFYIGTLLFASIAYLIGSINAGQILSILGSKNLGDTGSRNFGATNAGRVYGVKGFIGVFVFDMLKAIAAAIILTLILTQGTMSMETWANDTDYFLYYASIPLAMVWVVIGHSFPVYFGFKGGKGVASVFGCVLALNWVFAICSIIVFALVILVTRWTSLGSIIGTLFGVLLVITAQEAFYDSCGVILFFWSYSWFNILSALFLGFFITFRHRMNIYRMIKGIDPVFKPKGWKKPEETTVKATEETMLNKDITYKIETNEDWNNLSEGQELVSIKNDAYFGFRAMERLSKAILYDPTLIDSLVRVGKESKKFPATTHNLILDVDTLGFESSASEESFLKCATRVIEELLELNPDVNLDFTINCNNLNFDLIKETLYKIYVFKK